MLRPGEVSLWIWMAGLTVAGIVIFTAAMQMNQGQMEMVGEQMDSQTFTEIISKAKLACQAGEGTYYPMKINIGNNVKAIYSSKEDDEPPEKVSVMISRGQMSIGNYLCIRFFEDEEAYCENIGCNVNMTYIGTPAMDENLASLVNENMDSEVNSFEIIIKKKARKLVEITSDQSIAIDKEKELCGNGDVDSGEECDTNGYRCPRNYGKCTKRICTKECTCEVELDCELCNGEDQVCVEGSDWMSYCKSADECIPEPPIQEEEQPEQQCNPGIDFDFTQNVIYVATDDSGDYRCDGSSDQVEINQALSEITSLGGGTVHLKSGTYMIDNYILINSNTMLEGEEGTTVKLSPTADLETTFNNRNAMIQYTGSSSNIARNMAIKGFTIDGNSEAFSYSRGKTYGLLMRFNYVENLLVDSMTMQNGLGDGLNFRYSSGLIFVNNKATDLGHECVYMMDSTGAYIANNDVYTRTNSAFRFQQSNDGVVVNNYIHSRPSSGAFQSTGPGIEINNNCDNIEVYQNIIRNLDGSGLWMPIGEGGTIKIHHNIIYDVGKFPIENGYSNSGITTQGFNAIIEHNTIEEGGRIGIYVVSGTATIKDNIIVGSGVDTHTSSWTGSDPGVAISNDGGTTTIQNNCLYNNKANIVGSVTDNGGNIYDNPLFVNQGEQDYNLQSSSPCIGAASDGTDIGRYGGVINNQDDMCAPGSGENEGSDTGTAESTSSPESTTTMESTGTPESTGSQESTTPTESTGTAESTTSQESTPSTAPSEGCDYSKSYNQQRTIYVAPSGGTGDYVCDGTNDEEQINEAIAKVSSDSAYDTVFLKEGTYLIASTIQLRSNVVLTGDEKAIIKLRDHVYWSINVPMLKGNNIENIAIRCFEIDGNRDNNNEYACGKNYYNMIHITDSKTIDIDNMYLHDNWNDIFKVDHSSDIRYHDNVDRWPGHDVLYATGCTNVYAYGNDVHIFCNSGLRSYSSKNVYFYNNKIERDLTSGANAALEVQAESEVWICNNQISNVALELYHDGGIIHESGCPT